MSETMWDESYPPSLFNPEPPVVPVTGVTAGAPGAFVPANANPIPANLVALQSDPVVGNGGTNKPGAAWTVGQYVVLGNASQAYWNGVGWLAGSAPLVFVEDAQSDTQTASKRREKRARDES